MKKHVQILLFGAVSALLLSGCKNGFYFTNHKMYTQDDMTYFGTDKKQIDPITTIDIDSAYADIDIIASDDYYIEYSYYYITNEPKYTIKDGTLIFNDERINEGTFSINQRDENYLKLYIPSQAEFDEISIKKSSGELNVGSFVTKKADIRNSYGDITISDCKIQDLSLDSSSGNVLVENSEINGAKIENSYGELELNRINQEVKDLKDVKFDIAMSSGSLTIDQLNASNVDLTNSYGNVSISDSSMYVFSGRLSSGNVDFSDNAIENIEIDNSYGEIELEVPGKEDDYRIDIRNHYGSIKVGGVSYEEEYNSTNGTKLMKIKASSGSVKISFKK